MFSVGGILPGAAILRKISRARQLCGGHAGGGLRHTTHCLMLERAHRSLPRFRSFGATASSDRLGRTPPPAAAHALGCGRVFVHHGPDSPGRAASYNIEPGGAGGAITGVTEGRGYGRRRALIADNEGAGEFVALDAVL